ncbi:3-carboxy-cis,cis-muconate cycloisomerase [Mesorhizobium xinjiangense]|uniref:3-carboxy-cis,cis-muconate cycloisomerase n=1 Tax=Mesorhizobium xinjiangense TaxID=2678685 RepID=UPI0012EDC5C0|nr:3-carboxy-cis,cis-muconate cycloisomerase [Mesorhizobium xinjiangense]
MSLSPFDHPFLSGLLGDAEVGAWLSAEADLAAMLSFERALAEAEAAEGVIEASAAAIIAEQLAGFVPDMAKLKAGLGRDGVAGPELVRQLRERVGGEAAAFVHFGATSQDLADTSLAIRLRAILEIFGQRLNGLAGALAALEKRDGATRTMAHTRMQAAIPVPAARKIRSWRDPLERHHAHLSGVADEVCVLTFGGAAGTLDKLGEKGPAVTRRMAIALGLKAVVHARHSERDGTAGLASWLSLVTGSLGKMGQDIALLAQSEVGEVKLAGGGGSSAMPHKVNPVGAEVLVTLARFNATLVSGMHQSLVHENERSGAAWTLEWMLLPQMLLATGAALRIASEVVDGVSFVDRGAQA